MYMYMYIVIVYPCHGYGCGSSSRAYMYTCAELLYSTASMLYCFGYCSREKCSRATTGTSCHSISHNPNGSVSTTMVTEYAPTATAMTRSPWKRPHCNTGPRVHLKSSICLSREFSRSMWSSSFSNPRPRPLPSFVFVDLRCCSRPGVWQVSHWPFASKPLLLHMIRLQLARVIIKGRQTSYSVPLSTVLYV